MIQKFRFQSVVVYEQEIVDGKPSSIKIVSKFTTSPKATKAFNKKKKGVETYTSKGDAEVETR